MAAEIAPLSAERSLTLAERRSTPWWLTALLVLVVILLVGGLIASVVILRWQMDYQAAKAAVTDEVARIQASGEPMTIDDLFKWQTIRDGASDTTSLWLAAMEARIRAGGPPHLPFVGTANPAVLQPDIEGSQLAAAAAYLEDHDVALRAILAAAKAQGECRFPLEFEKGIHLEIAHLQGLRDMMQLLQLSVHTRAIQGDIGAALDSLEAEFATAGALEHAALLTEHLVRNQLVRLALYDCEWLMNERQLTSGQLERLEKRVKGIDLQSSLTRALIGERAMGYHLFHHLNSLSTSDVQTDLKLPGVNLPLMRGKDGVLARPADCLFQLKLFEDVIAASRLPFPQTRQSLYPVHDRMQTVSQSSNPLERMKYAVSLLMTPAIQPAFDSTGRAIARQRAVLASIAAERYRLRHGRFPARLDDLVPEFFESVPLDPFNGQTLLMMQDNGDLLIYSVGVDRRDNGGVENDQRWNQPDIVVKLKAKAEKSKQ